MWATAGRNAASLQAFFAGLGDEQKQSIKAVSIDMSAGYEKAITEAVPNAQICFDPFHVVQLGGKAADQVRRDEYNRHGRSATGEGKWIKGTRYSLLKDTAKQTTKQLLKLAEPRALIKASLRVQHVRNADERFSCGSALRDAISVAEKKRSAKSSVSGIFTYQFDVNTDRTAARKGVERKRPGMGDIELQIDGSVNGRKFWLAVLGLGEFDRLGSYAETFGQELAQGPPGHDVMPPIPGVVKFVRTISLVAGQQLP